MWIIRKYHAWRRTREDYVIAKAILLGADIHPYISNNDARYHNAARGLPTIYYRAFAPTRSGLGDVTVYGKTVYECAKRWLDTQELTL